MRTLSEAAKYERLTTIGGLKPDAKSINTKEPRTKTKSLTRSFARISTVPPLKVPDETAAGALTRPQDRRPFPGAEKPK